MSYLLIEIGDDLQERTLKTLKIGHIHRATHALVREADRRYGKAGWNQRRDQTLVGMYAVASDGRCLSIAPKF